MSLVDDVGKKWSFEFCFWYSKESRIYYFKKFYPYVQSRNLRGGDTGAEISKSLPEFLYLDFVVFSHLNPPNIQSPNISILVGDIILPLFVSTLCSSFVHNLM